MKADLAYNGGKRTWIGLARWAALAATVGLGVAVFGGGACSATPGGTDFNTGGSGSTQSGTQSGTPSGTQSGTPSGTQSGGVMSGGGNGVGSFVGSGIGGSGSGNNSTGVGGSCASTHAEGKTTPLDIYIMLDKSGSMQGAKWSNVTTALNTFVDAPTSAGIGVGLQYFPIQSVTTPPACAMCTTCACIQSPPCGCSGCICINGVCSCGSQPDSCSSTDYATAAVEIAPLPGNAPPLHASINVTAPLGGTPTRVSLEGALSHARDWAVAHPDHKVVVVFATDGEPSGGLCEPNSIADAQAIAQMYFNGTPSIPTYVISVGLSSSSCDQIAASGGTMMAFNVDAAGNTQQFIDAMNAIRNAAGLSCEYSIPAVSDGGALDPTKVNVQYHPGGGGPAVDIYHVQDASACDPVKGGWYYDNNASPTKILICPTTCTTIEADAVGSIDILFGCPTIDLPPN